ncbi:MAG TPA: gliding motility-associated C-terminal domain-containing protein, partial [Bacteroidales bacterium]|nr:gliding motility-associated C-terminal domain-containing protein [Bacteroidales bacterium]
KSDEVNPFDEKGVEISDGVVPYSLVLNNLSINGNHYEWFVYNQDNQLIWTGTDEFPSFTIDNEGYYHIVLVSTSRESCRDTMEWGEFYVESASKLEVPNIFTPNGDNINDYFQVIATTLSDFHGIITNRWGKKLYEWDNWEDEEAGWDGKIGNSLAVPGAYFYIIKATGKDGTEYDLQGTFYLMREK